MSLEERRIFEDYVNLRQQYMNLEADPSIDFFEYACGKYQDEESEVMRTERRLTWIDFMDAIIIMLKDENITNPLLEKARNFHRSRDVLLQNGIQEFLKSEQFIDFCGGVPAFNDNWNEENFDWVKAVGILNALGFFSLIYLNVEYKIDNGNLTKIITVQRGFVDRSIHDDLAECVEMLELSLEKLADVVNDMNLVEERYHRAEIGNEHESWFWQDMNDFEIFDLKVFMETACSLTVHDYDIIVFEPGIIECLEILNSLDRKTLANYIGVHAVYEDHNLYKPTALRKFFSYFKPALISAGFEIYLNEQENEKLQIMIDLFEESFERIQSDFPPDIRGTGQFLFGTDINLLRQDISEIYNPTEIIKVYENLQIFPDNFFQNVINIKNHGDLNSFTYYFSTSAEKQERTFSLQSLFEYAVEHYKRPLAYHFARSLPFMFWLRAIYARIEYDEDAPANYKRENDNFKIPVEILKSQIEQREDWIESFVPKDVTENLELLTYTYRDYENWMKKNEATVKWQDEILSKINLNCRKFFFVNFVLEFQIYQNVGTGICTLMNFPSFIKSFEFRPDSPMNPRGYMLIN